MASVGMEVCTSNGGEPEFSEKTGGLAGTSKPLRILVAEDHDTNRRLALLMLEKLGHRADVAGNGRETVEAWEKSGYDLILMDCHMPDMDGLEATREIRRREAARPPGNRGAVKIVALTANVLTINRERCLAAGMDDYLTKPFTSAQLRKVLLKATPTSCVQSEIAPPAAVILNEAYLAQLCSELDPQIVADIMGDFVRDLPESLAKLKQFTVSRNWPEAERIAHSLKGVSATFGFELLTSKLKGMEQAAEDKDDGTAQGLQAELEPLGKRVVSALNQWLKTAYPNIRR